MKNKNYRTIFLTLTIGVILAASLAAGCGNFTGCSKKKKVEFTAIAGGDKAVYSYDGITWEETALPGDEKWRNISYGNGRFVTIAGDSNKAAYSDDGIKWTAASLPVKGGWGKLFYGNGKFVAISSDKAVYSTDGIKWETAQLPKLPDEEDWTSWRGLCYGKDKFITISACVLDDKMKVAYSYDGIKWETASLPDEMNCFPDISYGNGKFVLVTMGLSSTGTNKAAYSEDGIKWTMVKMPNQAGWVSVCYGKDKFVAVSNQEMILFDREAAYSYDGIKWLSVTMPDKINWHSVSYIKDKFIAMGEYPFDPHSDSKPTQSDFKAAYSEDGLNWEPAHLPHENFWGICYIGE